MDLSGESEHYITMDIDDEYSTAASSPLSLPTSSPLTTPELSDDGLDTERLPSPLHELSEDLAPSSTSFVLVIGGLGYIGSHTAVELLREGYNGKKTSSPPAGSPVDRLQSSLSTTLATATRQSLRTSLHWPRPILRPSRCQHRRSVSIELTTVAGPCRCCSSHTPIWS